MAPQKRTEIIRFLQRMNLDQEQILLIQTKAYSDCPELFEYVFELASAFEELEEVNEQLLQIKKIENETRARQAHIMVKIFNLKTQTSFKLKKECK